MWLLSSSGQSERRCETTKIAVADLGEVPGRAQAPPLFWVKKKESQNKEKLAGQVSQKPSTPFPP